MRSLIRFGRHSQSFKLIYGVFTLPDTDTDFTFTNTGTDTDTMGLKPNCICVSVGVSMNTSTQFSTTHFLSVSVSSLVSGSVNTPLPPFDTNLMEGDDEGVFAQSVCQKIKTQVFHIVWDVQKVPRIKLN